MGNQHSIVEEMFPLIDEGIQDILMDELGFYPLAGEEMLPASSRENDSDVLDKIGLVNCAIYYNRSRLDWWKHVDLCTFDNTFEEKYRMTFAAFESLHRLVKDKLFRDPRYVRRGEYICSELVLAIGIRYLAGEKVTALQDIFGVSRSSIYEARDQFLSAVLECDELRIKMPQTDEEWTKVTDSFDYVAASAIHQGNCCGAIDGFFQPTRKPRLKESRGNPKAYLSGHYSSYGLNCQAVCDARLRFLFFGVVAPGNTNDCMAYKKCKAIISAMTRMKKDGYFVGDAAYEGSERMIIPFTGANRIDPDMDAFNYFLSNLRIRIEMAFGRLVQKWWILQSKLNVSLRTSSRILMVCARLHNFVIDEDEAFQEIKQYTEYEMNANGKTFINSKIPMMNYLPTIPDKSCVAKLEEQQKLESSHVRRAVLLERLKSLGDKRPRANKERKALEIKINNGIFADGCKDDYDLDEVYLTLKKYRQV